MLIFERNFGKLNKKNIGLNWVALVSVYLQLVFNLFYISINLDQRLKKNQNWKKNSLKKSHFSFNQSISLLTLSRTIQMVEFLLQSHLIQPINLYMLVLKLEIWWSFQTNQIHNRYSHKRSNWLLYPFI